MVLRWVDLLIHHKDYELAADLMDNTYIFPTEMNQRVSYVHTCYAEAHFGLGEKYLEEGKYREALDQFETGSKYPAHLNDIYASNAVTSRRDFLIGLAHEKSGNKKKAREQWEKVIHGNSREFSESDFYKVLALYKVGKKSEGKEQLDALISHHTEKLNNVQDEHEKSMSHYVLYRVYDHLGKKEEAEEHFRKGLSLNHKMVIDGRLEGTYVPVIEL
ncbi:MAG: hypothetical protein ACOCUP_00050 [bacterium]